MKLFSAGSVFRNFNLVSSDPWRPWTKLQCSLKDRKKKASKSSFHMTNLGMEIDQVSKIVFTAIGLWQGYVCIHLQLYFLIVMQ